MYRHSLQLQVITAHTHTHKHSSHDRIHKSLQLYPPSTEWWILLNSCKWVVYSILQSNMHNTLLHRVRGEKLSIQGQIRMDLRRIRTCTRHSRCAELHQSSRAMWSFWPRQSSQAAIHAHYSQHRPLLLLLSPCCPPEAEREREDVRSIVEVDLQ